MKLQGRIPAIPTPLTDDECVHEQQLRGIVEHLLARGVHGFWTNGGFGGYAHLRDQEQIRAVEIVVDQVKGRVPVLAGITDNSATLAIERAVQMKEVGADYLFLSTPSYDMWNNQTLISFFREIAQNVGLPLLIYNNPWSTHIAMDTEVIFALGRESNIIGIKDSSENPYQLVSLVDHFRSSDFTLLVGTMPLGCYALQIGFDGVVDPTDVLYIEMGVAMFDAARAGNWQKAIEWQNKIDELGRVLMNLGDYRGAVETCLIMLGLCDKISPRPFGPIRDPEKLKLLKEMLISAGLAPVRLNAAYA